MAIKNVTRSVADCDGCGKALEHEYDDGRAYFTHEDETRQALDELGWQFTPDGQLHCRLCAAPRKCAQDGHRFSHWEPCRCRGRKQEPGHGWQCEWYSRQCYRCFEAESRRLGAL